MTDDTSDRVSRRSVLKTSALATSTLPLVGGLSVGTVTGATQEGETFLELFTGESPLLVARGDALGLDDEAIPSPHPWRDARVRGPERILAFVPRRLAEQADGRVGLEQMLVMTGVRALDSPDATSVTDGALVPGNAWFPGSQWFPGSSWEPGRPPWWESGESVERGTSLRELVQEERGLLFGAAGPTFFPDDVFDEEFAVAWEELARAETATVIEPDDLRG